MRNRSAFDEERNFRGVELLAWVMVGIPIDFDGGDFLNRGG